MKLSIAARSTYSDDDQYGRVYIYNIIIINNIMYVLRVHVARLCCSSKIIVYFVMNNRNCNVTKNDQHFLAFSIISNNTGRKRWVRLARGTPMIMIDRDPK